ncbi:MAG: transcriptional repressor [Alphaproteobacteria bacterium]|jgi:Fur family zinc uptake transcriptional regulator|nr:transcriptional repressor [Alphaproteobacteria bacterium]
MTPSPPAAAQPDTRPADSPAFDLAAAEHDHGACVDDALARAEALCAARGTRLTPIRRKVLELVWRGHRPRGAYDILDDLGRDGRRPAPLTVYRALDFLLEQGLVHRLESLNAFVGCPHPGAGHPSQFLVCERCGTATERADPTVAAAIAASADAVGFTVDRQVVEIRGVCPNCRAA